MIYALILVTCICIPSTSSVVVARQGLGLQHDPPWLYPSFFPLKFGSQESEVYIHVGVCQSSQCEGQHCTKRQLQRKNLDLCLYPTLAPLSSPPSCSFVTPQHHIFIFFTRLNSSMWGSMYMCTVYGQWTKA